jgi:cation:H+ antiporter
LFTGHILADAALMAGFLFVLARSAIFAIDALTRFSRMTGIGEFAAGFILLSVSTSSPEISVAMFSVFEGNVGITLGDIFGSNVTNIALIASLFLLLSPVRQVGKKTVRSLSLLLTATALIAILLLLVHDGARPVGAALLAFYAFFVYRTLRASRKEAKEEEEDPSGRAAGEHGSPYRQLLLFLGGIALVVVSAKVIVDSAVSIAEYTGIRQSVIGATIIALGTSLPELAVDIVAVRRRHLELALGDIIGSSITNIALVLGIVLVLSEVSVNFGILSTLIAFVVISHVAFFALLRKGRVARWHSIVLFAIYAAFLLAIYEVQLMIGGLRFDIAGVFGAPANGKG